MQLALEKSTIYNAIHWRLGSALIGNDMISQYRSKPLDDQRWISEAQRVFESSLARAQFDAWSIASGEDSVLEGSGGYVDSTPREAGNLCGIYKFNSSAIHQHHAYCFCFALVCTVDCLVSKSQGGRPDQILWLENACS